MVRETILRLAQASAEREEHDLGQSDTGPTASIESFEAWFLAHAQAADQAFDSPHDGPGECLGRFRILRKLGSGGFGIVFLAFDPLLQREIALKLPRPELLVDPNWAGRVLHEARIAATLDHPGIVPVHEVGAIGPVWYIASAYCDGHSLAMHASLQPELMAINAAAELIACVADALQHAHSRGVLHRDLKTANILLTRSNHRLDVNDQPPFHWNARLTDFGLAVRDSELSPVSVPRVAGTPAYMPPELAAASRGVHSIQSDVYSLGAVLFELLTGRPPFVAETPAATLELVQQGKLPSVRSIRSAVSADLDAIVGKCLRHSPQDRYQSAASLASDLRAYLAGAPVAARPMRAIARTIRWCRNRPILTALSAMLVIAAFVATGGITWQWRRAENHLSMAEAERNKAERRSAQLERALLDLSTATEDSEFWQDHTRVLRHPEFFSATSPFRSLLFDSRERGNSLPLLALSYDQLAIHHELQSEFSLSKECHRKSITQWYAIVRDAPDDPLYRRRLNQACYAYGRFLCIREKVPTGLVYIHDDRLLEIVPLSDGQGFELARDYLQFVFDHGSNLAKAKGWEGAASTFVATRDLGRALLARKPNDTHLAALFAKSAMMLGRTTRSSGDRRAGATLLQQAYDEAMHQVELHPDDVPIALVLAETCEALTSREFKGTDWQRRDLLEKAILPLDRALDRSPERANCDNLRVVAKLYRERANTFRSMELVESEVKSSLLRACEYYDRLLTMSNATTADVSAAAMGYYEAAKVCDQLAQEDEALTFATKAVDAFSKQVPGKEPRLARIEAHVDCLALQANHLHVAGKPAEAAETLRKGIAVIENSEVRFPNNAHLADTKRKLTAQLEHILRGDDPAKL